MQPSWPGLSRRWSQHGDAHAALKQTTHFALHHRRRLSPASYAARGANVVQAELLTDTQHLSLTYTRTHNHTKTHTRAGSTPSRTLSESYSPTEHTIHCAYSATHRDVSRRKAAALHCHRRRLSNTAKKPNSSSIAPSAPGNAVHLPQLVCATPPPSPSGKISDAAQARCCFTSPRQPRRLPTPVSQTSHPNLKRRSLSLTLAHTFCHLHTYAAMSHPRAPSVRLASAQHSNAAIAER